MKQFLTDFANAMASINLSIDGHRSRDNQYAPGIGPYGEDQIVDRVMALLSQQAPDLYIDHHIRPGNSVRRILGLEGYTGPSGSLATPDLVLSNRITEFKIARPLRDNGEREDTWFKKVFEPNPDSYSTFLDVEKLCLFDEKHDPEGKFEKWVVIIGFERLDEKEYDLDGLFPGLFTYISEKIRGRKVREFINHTAVLGDRHPYHQVAKLYAFRY
ncbi:hypothetical protein EG832_05275 [bacterium]|nr:hypothetical protein [bacterium]